MEDYPLLYSDIVFNAKPDAVPYNYRISYKVSQLCLIMFICGRGSVSSLVKLHMISFALFSSSNMSRLIEFAEGKGNAPIVRFDPAVNRALTYAIAYGFAVQQQNAKFKLTDHGQKLANKIILVDDIMVNEVASLNDLGKKLTDSKVDELFILWRDMYAES